MKEISITLKIPLNQKIENICKAMKLSEVDSIDHKILTDKQREAINNHIKQYYENLLEPIKTFDGIVFQEADPNKAIVLGWGNDVYIQVIEQNNESAWMWEPLQLDRSAWTYRSMIEDFLLVPDSAYNTNFALNAPSGGLIDNAIDRTCTFERQSLLDAVRSVADRIGYDGWIEPDVDGTPTIFLRPFGYLSSIATLTQPYLQARIKEGLDDVANYILVWGGTDSGIPADGDRWTERAIAKYSPAIWNLWVDGDATATTTLEDVVNTDFTYNGTDFGVGDYCVKATVTTTKRNLWTWIHPAANSETGVSTIDCKNRCTQISFHVVFKGSYPVNQFYGDVILIDSSNNRIKYGFMNGTQYFNTDIPYTVEIPVGPEQTIKNTSAWPLGYWKQILGSSFDWENVEYVEIGCFPTSTSATSETWSMLIDGFQFVGGYEIDPFASYADLLNPPVKDTSSINTYGVHVLHAQDTAINSFEYAQNEGNRVLSNLKTPIKKLSLVKYALSSRVVPSNIVTVTVPQFGISAEEWRVKESHYDWNSRRKTIYQTLVLVNKTAPLPPIWAEQPELRPFIK